MLDFGWYAVPESFKVYLTVDINEAAKRAFGDEKRKETENFETIEEQKQDLITRYNLENEIKSKNNNNYDEKIKKKFVFPYIFKNIFCIC